MRRRRLATWRSRLSPVLRAELTVDRAEVVEITDPDGGPPAPRDLPVEDALGTEAREHPGQLVPGQLRAGAPDRERQDRGEQDR